jgi:hypothetical protein
MTAQTTYLINDGRGGRALVRDAERAERLSRAGYTVTARTEAHA